MKSPGFLTGLAVGLAAGLLGLAAFVVTSRGAVALYVPLDRLHESGWLREQLHLDAAQVGQIEALEKGYATEVTSCCANHCGARKRLGESIFAGGCDPVKLAGLMERFTKGQMDSDLATIRHIQAVHALLRPDQQKKYETLVTSCVCADCPHCAEHDKIQESEGST